MYIEVLGGDDIALGPHLEVKNWDRFRLETIITATGFYLKPGENFSIFEKIYSYIKVLFVQGLLFDLLNIIIEKEVDSLSMLIPYART